MGWFREVIEPGALDGANLKDVPLLVNHNNSMIPVARSRNNTPKSTMRLKVTDRGLEMEADIDIERNTTARELDSAVERGDIDVYESDHVTYYVADKSIWGCPEAGFKQLSSNLISLFQRGRCSVVIQHYTTSRRICSQGQGPGLGKRLDGDRR